MKHSYIQQRKPNLPSLDPAIELRSLEHAGIRIVSACSRHRLAANTLLRDSYCDSPLSHLPAHQCSPATIRSSVISGLMERREFIESDESSRATTTDGGHALHSKANRVKLFSFNGAASCEVNILLVISQ